MEVEEVEEEVSATPTYSLDVTLQSILHHAVFFTRMCRLLSKPPAARIVSVTNRRQVNGRVGQCTVYSGER